MPQIKTDQAKRYNARRFFIDALSMCLPQPRETQPPQSPRSVLLLCPEKLGDCMLYAPLVDALSRHLPSAELHLACFSQASARFFAHDDRLTRVWRPKHSVADRRSLLRHRFDVLFNPKDNPSWTFLLWTLLVRSDCKIGLALPQHRKFHHILLPNDEHAHVLDKNLSLIAALGLPNDIERPALPEAPVREEIHAAAAALPDDVIGFNLSAGEGDREWPLAQWRQLAAKINRPFIVLCTPEKADWKRELEQQPGAVATPNTRSVFEAAALIAACALLVTPDTSLLHAAAAVNTPLVGLYRYDPFHHKRFAPRGLANRQLISPSHRVADIAVDDVLAALRELEAER